MKVISMFIIVVLTGCGVSQSLPHPSIAGTYVYAFKNEYNITSDTLILSVYNEEAGTYLIEDRSGFHRIREGKVLPKEYKQTKEIGHYDPTASQLMGQRTGRIYSFPSTGEGLLMGTAPYKKIK